jgi:nicotinate-nucleotide adenylyltransferase
MRIAVLGGTFNPIHYGHLRVAEEARESLGLDRVLFIPTNIPPHKDVPDLIPAETRLEMVRTAIEDNPGFEVSDIEISRGGSSYTIDTVKDLLGRGGEGLKVSLIIGNDSFNDITSWFEYEELFTLASFIIVPRPGYPVRKPDSVLPVELAGKFWYDSSSGSYVDSAGNSLTYLDATLLDISSSDIRDRVRNGRSIKYLLPDGVINCIREKGLYR